MVKAFRNDAVMYNTHSCEDGDHDEVSTAEETDDDEEDEEGDFNAKELQHNIAFTHLGKRLGCFAHSIQLVVQKFKDESLQPLMKRAHVVVKFNISSRATEMLLSLCGKKLISNVPTVRREKRIGAFFWSSSHTLSHVKCSTAGFDLSRRRES